MRTRFGVGQGVVVVFKIESAGGCNGVELMAEIKRK